MNFCAIIAVCVVTVSCDSSTSDSELYKTPAGATVPSSMCGDWTWTYDFGADGSNEGNGILALNTDGAFSDIEASSSYPGIWFLEGTTITVWYFNQSRYENPPEGSKFTGTVSDDQKHMSGTFVSQLRSHFGVWKADR